MDRSTPREEYGANIYCTTIYPSGYTIRLHNEGSYWTTWAMKAFFGCVTAPLTGVWYSAPSPGARPYLQLNGEVAAGQVVGLIEAMKLFNEIKSDVAGTVSRILADNGALVKRQQPLYEVRLA